MIYCQLQNRAKISIGQPLCLGDVARTTAPQEAGKLPLRCPDEEGVWKIESLACAAALQKAYPNEGISMLGADTCYVHRVHTAQRDPLKGLRTAAAFLIMLLGSALGLAWFHSDVDMPDAMLMVYHLITGADPADPHWITIPYIIGVALGVGVFYALPSRRATTPLEVKLTEYQEDMEKTEGKDVEHAP